MSESVQEKLSFVYDFYKDMAPYHLTYVYRGTFSKSLNEGILSLSESNLNNISEDSKVKKKVYFLMVESLQNITRHEDKSEVESPDTNSFFVIQRRDNCHLITSGNIIENQHIALLTSKLEKVNSLDQDKLKDYYREVLEKGELSARGGAGLGLIEMARKSGNKLAFDFVKINDLISYFYFQIRVSPAAPATEQEQKDALIYFESAKMFHRHLLDEDLHLVYQGHFSQDNLKNILGMIESGLVSKDGVAVRKKLFSVLVEALQNIFKHASDEINTSEGREGIFIIGKKDGNYRIDAGNLIANDKIEALTKKLEQVNNSDFQTLNDLYDKIILSDAPSEGTGAGLGLIDMKLKSGNNLVYNFQKLDNENSFYSLEITIADKNN